jgi:hypothetical protein
MSTIPATESERCRDEAKGRHDVCAPPANHNSDDQEVYSSALRGRT